MSRLSGYGNTVVKNRGFRRNNSYRKKSKRLSPLSLEMCLKKDKKIDMNELINNKLKYGKIK